MAMQFTLKKAGRRHTFYAKVLHKGRCVAMLGYGGGLFEFEDKAYYLFTPCNPAEGHGNKFWVAALEPVSNDYKG